MYPQKILDIFSDSPAERLRSPPIKGSKSHGQNGLEVWRHIQNSRAVSIQTLETLEEK